MGFYGEQLLPRVMDRVCAMSSNQVMRDRVCAGLSGDVVEIGFGSGLNVGSYPPAVTSVAAVEPSSVAWGLAGKRLAAPQPRYGVPGWTASPCRSTTRPSTRRCRRGRCARSRTCRLPWTSSGGC